MVLHEPFELDYWFVQVFSGNPMIFSIIFVLIMSFFCAKMKVPTSVFASLVAIFGGIMLVEGLDWIQFTFIALLLPVFYILWRRSVE